jgi:putative ABC transport system permease protein
LSWVMSLSLETDLFRIPLIVYPSTFGWAAIVVTVSSFVSGLLVRQRLNHLDLFAVLKGKE